MIYKEGGCEAVWDSVVNGNGTADVLVDCTRCRIHFKGTTDHVDSDEKAFNDGIKLALNVLSVCPKWQELQPSTEPPKKWFYFRSTIFAKAS